MGMTWTSTPTPDDVAFETIKTALETGHTYLNSADFYGLPSNPTANVSLMARFFAAYPQFRETTVVGIKGGVDTATIRRRNDPEFLSASIKNINEIFSENRPTNIIFIPARNDPNVPVETVISHLAEHVKAGDIQGIGISEVGAATIRRAAKIHPISAVEIEMSLISQEALGNGVVETCAELGIPITAYAPLGRGLLAGRFGKEKKIAEGDIRGHLERFQGENFEANLRLGEEIAKVAEKEGVKSSQLLLAWVRSQSKKGGVVVPIPGATRKERVEENLPVKEVSDEVLKELEEVVKKVGVKGLRYNQRVQDELYA